MHFASLRYAAAADMGKGQLFLGLSNFEPFKSAARWMHRATIKERSSSQSSLLGPARSCEGNREISVWLSIVQSGQFSKFRFKSKIFRSDWISRSHIPMSDSMLQVDPKVNRPWSGSETAPFHSCRQ